MNHGPAVEMGVDHASSKKARLGVLCFFIYFIFYTGFVVIGVVNYELLSQEFAFGLSLALFYGVGLIVFAVLLGILYNFFCTRYENLLNKEEKTV